jgi:hypothetical protein
MGPERIELSAKERERPKTPAGARLHSMFLGDPISLLDNCA